MHQSSALPWRFALACLFLAMTVLPTQAAGADRQETIRQARASYYSLQSEGLAEFRCQLKPDWDTIFGKSMTDDQGRNEVMPIVRQVRFHVVVGPNGNSTVSHESDVAPPDEAVAERVRKIIAGVEQVITGFFQTWQGFAITPPFPEVEGEYQLEDQGETLRVTNHQGSADVKIAMDRNFAISEMSIVIPQVEATIQPHLSLREKQYLLAGYDFDYKLPPAGTQHGTVKIDNQSVEGLVLPSRVDIRMTLSTGPVEFPTDFTDYVVKKR